MCTKTHVLPKPLLLPRYGEAREGITTVGVQPPPPLDLWRDVLAFCL